MTYPTQPQYPGFPQPQAPQMPQQPGYPAPPAQSYPQPQAYPQPPQQYGPPQGYPQPPQQPAPQLAAGTLDGYFSQPSVGGGAALKFEVGTTHVGIVARPVTNADVQQQTNPQNGQPAFYRDGRPKFVMKVPLRVQPGPGHEDGQAQWYVAGAARDELVRAMAEAGAPEGPPEAGALIQVTCTGTRPSGAGMSPSKVYQVRYQRPDGAAATPPPAQPAAPAAPPVQQMPPPAPPVQQAQTAPPAPPQAAPAAAPVQQAPHAAPPAPPAPAVGGDLSPEQQALLAKLTGQPAA